MIVKMKQVTLLASQRERANALKELRRLGVLHVTAIKTPTSEEVYSHQNQIADIERALAMVSELPATAQSEQMEPSDVVVRLLEIAQKKETLNNELIEKNEAYSWFENWGHTSYGDLMHLEKAGIHLRFYKTDAKSFAQLPQEKEVIVLERGKEGIKLVLIGRTAEETLPLSEYRMPAYESAGLELRRDEIKQELRILDDEVNKLAAYRADMESLKKKLLKQLEYAVVAAGMGSEKEFVYLQGFCPVDQVETMKISADEHGWGYLIADPDDPAAAPTLLRNNKLIRIIQPMFDLLGTFPGYLENDISPVFLLFFSLFYAIIIGDAGYGVLFLLITLWVSRKYKKIPREPIFLFLVLSIGTIIWGAMTGTWFGSKAISELPFFKLFIIDKMYSFNASEESLNFMIKFTFILGTVHLSIARLWAGAKKLPSITALAEVGWVLILWCVFFVANQLILGETMPPFAIYLLIVGGAMVSLFANFQKNVLKGFLISLANLPLSVIGSFGDIVSYIRLFAVSIAGVTVASSFNDMAHGIVAPLVLVLAHALNMVLGMMSVLVHGVRLNILEFSTHLGQEWSGKAYKPFKE
ncbi:MAG: hypothetical protein EHM72_08240 [Calditrichaeota bacterium]|nr:MAG: hypothetical protein EHM72_08240 [Calditrichota bacterium]